MSLFYGLVPTGSTKPLSDISASIPSRTGYDVVSIDFIEDPNWFGPRKYNATTKTAEKDIIEDDWINLRHKRNHLLSLTDFTQFSDSPCTAPEITDWGTYRQSLRDLPTDPGAPSNPTWPTPPATPTIEGV